MEIDLSVTVLLKFKLFNTTLYLIVKLIINNELRLNLHYVLASIYCKIKIMHVMILWSRMTGSQENVQHV